MSNIHSLADVKTKNIGENTLVWQFCVILRDVKIGRNCNICAQVFIENNVLIGNNVTIKSGAQLFDGLTVEDNVFIGPNVSFTNDMVPRSKKYPESYLKTVLKKGCSIGAGSVIIAGLVIGQYAFVGAGSVVTKNVPANTVWYGNPAVQKGFITNDGEILDMNMKDKKGIKHVSYL
ncbi:acyltransferase [uncultured Bacteroides sp.]|uniref:acyltransferase n=1 Tax=uncultured Bacteroides sp. TaxID=162156 RepID=UPI002AAB4525|nr:acyltransferase [uncultured Bacteroides sp.]